MKGLGKVITALLTVLILASCGATRSLQDGEYLLKKNKILVNDKKFNAGKLSQYVRQKANKLTISQGFYNLAGKKDNKFNSFLRRIGTPPVVYNPSLVDVSIENMKDHLTYLGYYGSEIDSRISLKKRKVFVNYYVTLGRRFKISRIDYDLPQTGTFVSDFKADRRNVSVHPGDYLSESSLEAESERSSAYLRTIGYYDLTKSNYSFVADTLTEPGVAALKMIISGDHIHKFHIDSVRISHPDRIKLRPRMLAGLNTIRPGDLYDERAVNTTYSRFSAIPVLNGVNVSLAPSGEDKVSCDISLQHTRLQGFKANLEFSSNSSALLGISPQLSYFHKNIFHGGEMLNLSFMGNFQFKPKSDIRAMEFGVTAQIRFPGFMGIPNRSGANIPQTDVNASFNFQDRPEYKRTMISTSFGYTGSLGKRFFYQVYPARLGIVRIFNMSDDFRDLVLINPYLASAYSNHFDLGLGGTLYYTTDSKPTPQGSYHYYRLAVDLSGNLLSAFNKTMKTDASGAHLIWGIPYSQYVRAEAQVGRTFVFGRKDAHAISLRLLAGAGYGYGNSVSLPYEKVFYAGGASSLRGWQARTIGPGKMPMDQTFLIPSQIGDWKLEANLEYRFKIFWKIEGATFLDAGNVWALHKGSGKEERFSWDSIAADWGIGLRLNMDIIVVRVDFGMQIHDPVTEERHGWLGPDKWFRRGNNAFHFGVGYPF